MGILTFDWGQITFANSPFMFPWWAAAHMGAAVVFFYWILVPILYVSRYYFSLSHFSPFSESRLSQYTNVWYSAYLPLVSSVAFDNTGRQYNVSQIINSDSSLNLQAYKGYSPIFLSASFAISYGLSFATVTAAISHTFLYYRKYIWAHARRPLSQKPDIHARLMSVYKEVPVWWYLTIFSLSHRLFILKKYADTLSVTMVVFGVVVIEVWETGLPVWGFVLALSICASCLPSSLCSFFPTLTCCVLAFTYTIPLSMITATTGQLLGLNVITELIIGYALPGRPVAMMLFKTWGYNTMTQALRFMFDLKLAHYMKVPHRPMFSCQVFATIVAATVQLGVQTWMFSNIEGLCDADQKDGFTCPRTTVFGNASILVSLSCLHISFCISWLKCCFAVGCDWAATSIFSRPAILWPPLLLPGRLSCTIVPVDIAQEVQNIFPQVRQFPSRLRLRRRAASCDPL